MPEFVVILSQGRSGSTLLLRMLNAVPDVRIAGENERAIDHLRSFVKCFEVATTRHDTEFYRLAWSLPCPVELIRSKVEALVADLYNPTGDSRLVGFKEIRYGRGDYQEMSDDIQFLREVMPGLKIIFNTRRTEDVVKSEWWALKPSESKKLLTKIRANFEKYFASHRDYTFLMPYEEMKRGSSLLPAMFNFLGLEFTPEAASELDKKLR